MPTKAAVRLAEVIVGTTTAGSSAGGTYMGGQLGPVVQLMAEQIDAAVDIVEVYGKQGKISRGAFAVAMTAAVGKKFVPGLNFIDDQAGKCFGALTTLGLSTTIAVITAPTGVGLFITGLGMLADMYSVYNDCIQPRLEKANKAKAARLLYEVERWRKTQNVA